MTQKEALTVNYHNFSNQRRKRLASEHVYRIGPAPRDEIDLTKERKEGPKVKKSCDEIGSLDGNLETRRCNEQEGTKLKLSAPSRTLLIYFAKMATTSTNVTVDYDFLSSLINSGAHVNVADKHGQTVMHEVARNWSIDVAKFFLINGVDVNKPDEWGRTPLHLSAAVNHSEMVEYLLNNGANATARTKDEWQTPIHYAAKYNAVTSLKVLIDNRGNYNCRDYKERTPLFLAAEMAQEDSARYLLDLGVPVGVFDDTGMSAIALMIEKMPHIAVDGLNQFHSRDVAFRKERFYLNYLEGDPKEARLYQDVDVDIDKSTKKAMKQRKRLACPTTALELTVNRCEDKVIMHPVMQQLIRTKWNLFGKLAASIEFIIHLAFCIIWTSLGIFLPRDGAYYQTELYWRIPVEAFGVLLTFFFILKQIWESKINFKQARKYRLWRLRQIKRDLKYCHPRWSQEKIYLEHELKNLHERSRGFLADPWNIMEFLTYTSVMIAIVTRVIHVFHANAAHDSIHLRAYAFSLIFLWIHFMKSCRTFTALGLFITMLGYVVKETLVFVFFLCFEVLIPYMVAFWILFGGSEHAKTIERNDEDSQDWKGIPDLMFSVWQITVIADFNLDAILAVDKTTAQIMVGSFWALCALICINLHIAFLTETFCQVYTNAKAHTSRLQATTVLQYEKLLTKNKLKKIREHFQSCCAPLIVASEGDVPTPLCTELSRRTIRIVLSRLNKCKEFLLNRFLKTKETSSTVNNVQYQMYKKYLEDKETYDLYQGLLERHKVLYALKLDLHELKCTVLPFVDRRYPLPSKPRYIPLPTLDIRPPYALNTIQQGRKKHNGSNNQTRRTTQDDGQFETFLNTKSYGNIGDDTRGSRVTFDETLPSDTSESDSQGTTVDIDEVNQIYESVDTDNLITDDKVKKDSPDDSCKIA